MKTLLSILMFTLLIGCREKYSAKNISENSTKPKITQKDLIGVWTNGSHENATFEIKQKTIYYVDDFADYKYSLKNDTIEINYPDYVYRAEVLLRNDTLIMNSKDSNPGKYWKFKG